MVVFTEDGERLGQVNDIYYWPINESHTEFQFMGRMPAEFVDHVNANGAESKYRFMVFANCGDHASGEQYITYSHAQLDPTREESAIPMWGVKVNGVAPLVLGRSLDLGEISLLRAAAKVEVKLTDELKDKGTEITAATLKYYNQTGYVLPSGWSQVSNTQALDQENCIRVYRHAAVNLPLVKEDDGSYYIYTTEYDNINYTGERNKISLEFNIGGEIKAFEDAISFCQYSNGAPVESSHYSIVRNHIYEFEILSIAGSSLMLEYHVADWSAEDWGNGEEYEEHDLSYPTYHNPVVPREYFNASVEEQATYKITKEPTMYYGGQNDLEAGAFECYFQILAPESVEWKPSFMNSKENYRIRIYRMNPSQNLNAATLIFDSDDDNKQSNIGVCESSDWWYRIVVFPKSNDGADNTQVEFGISYYQSWTDQYINLYINGDYNNIRWPNSGDNPKLINIRHISAVQGAM